MCAAGTENRGLEWTMCVVEGQSQVMGSVPERQVFNGQALCLAPDRAGGDRPRVRGKGLR